ncbi:terpenoid synthase [Aspergillus ruber CBS 135680]|uniref:Terpenoid synthase n=1 Tax=Aspergillus ruber (strain CBS 135680) TaxID=1388766 RepID=A0A017SP65_ASPRC|nr:terpenoid synthase [Aspergillus ruber CBS 135680]EYE98762.1 terpenoid synthase [Aspergillus ruber CBS 135680]
MPFNLGSLVSSNAWMFKVIFTNPNMLLIILIIVFALVKYWHASQRNTSASSSKLVPDCQLTKKEYEDIINSFLQEISFKIPVLSCNLELKRQVRNRLKSQGVSAAVIEQIQVSIETGVKITSCTYSFASPPIQEAIATYASYVISIDDLTSGLSKDLQIYTTKLTLGQPHQHTLLRGLTSHLSEQHNFFGSFGGDMIIKGTLEFISSANIEKYQTESLRLTRDASDYLFFFRAKTGVAEPFAFFCFPEDTHPEATDLEKYISAVPSIMLFLGHVNDILSFYKEEIKNGDSPSFLHSHSKLHNITSLQSLRQIKTETVEVIQKLRNIFAEDELLLEHIEKFIQGYVLYHLSCTRYKLSELNIPEAIEATRRDY